MIGYGEPTVTDSLGRVLTFSIDGIWSYTGNTLWQTATPAIPNPRDEAGAAVAPNGIAYLVGGSLQRFDVGTGIIEGYDANAKSWKTGLVPMPTARTELACAASAATGRATRWVGRFGRIQRYHHHRRHRRGLQPDRQHLGEPVRAARSGVGAGGGRRAGRSHLLHRRPRHRGANLSTVNAYSAVSNRWSPVTPLDTGKFGVAAAVAPDGHIWAVGGSTNPELDGFKTVLIYGPTVAVTPPAAAAGAMASVSGNNFAANATVSVYFGSTATAPVGTGTTNASGALAAAISFRVPNLAAGEQALIVMDDRSQYPITLSFRVQ